MDIFHENRLDVKGLCRRVGKLPELRKACTIANEANLDPDELDDLERREIFIQDQRGAITKATRIGIEKE